jgi:flagellar assembly protein FliH
LSARAKFMFDVDFAAGSDPARRAITPAAHEAAIAEARANAYRDGIAAAVAEAEARAAVALERIAGGLADLARKLDAIEARLEVEAIEVAVAVACKLAPELIAREPFAEISALAIDCFRHLVAAPHVVVRVNDQLHASAREKLEETTRLGGFDGRLVVLAEPDIAPGDCRIEWADGGVKRDRAATEAAIAEAVARYIAGRRGETNTSDVPWRPQP